MKILPAGGRFVKPGDKHWSWTVLGRSFCIRNSCGTPYSHVVAECDCGTVDVLVVAEMKRGHPKTCGCKSRNAQRRIIRHPELNGITEYSLRRLNSIYSSMKTRCTNPKAINYKDYGGRGISVCEEWRQSSAVFVLWAVKNGYNDSLTLERENVNGHYCPENCIWADQYTQGRNRRNNRTLTAFGETKLMKDWPEDDRCRVSFGGLRVRVAAGMPDEEAITKPPRNAGRKR